MVRYILRLSADQTGFLCGCLMLCCCFWCCILAVVPEWHQHLSLLSGLLYFFSVGLWVTVFCVIYSMHGDHMSEKTWKNVGELKCGSGKWAEVLKMSGKLKIFSSWSYLSFHSSRHFSANWSLPRASVFDLLPWFCDVTWCLRLAAWAMPRLSRSYNSK